MERKNIMQKRYSMKFITRFIFISLILTFFAGSLDAQVYQWQKLRYELILGGGVTNFMGDVGAPLDEGLNSYFWTNPNTWRPVGVVGGRMAFGERHMVKTVLSTGFFYANDAYGDKRNNQYELRTFFAELSGQYEFYLIPEQQKRNIYRFIGASQRFKNLRLPTYLFAGVSGLFFNPKTLFDDEWIALQPLQTEKLSNGKDQYSRIALAVPVGIGVKFKIAKYISMNIEAGWRLAFTDYIDDLGSGDFYNLREIAEAGDYTRAAVSYRSHGYSRLNEDLIEQLLEQAPTGGSRGSGEWFDQYQFVTATLNFKLQTGRKGEPRLRLYR
jgi:OOP family OmpA-OmpF porin